MTEPTAIRARIHESALKRVTRSYSASLGDIFAETLQNARRAGATVVHVSLRVDSAEKSLIRITVADNGNGIDDPAVLLSFGENGWDQKLVHREDAAGMGMLSLARHGCIVTSRPLSAGPDLADGWRVTLAPEHFLGEADALVEPCIEAPAPWGTTVSFSAAQFQNADTVRHALEAATRYFPLRVVFNHRPHTPPEGEELPRRIFLDGAVHAENWRGLIFGVFRNRAKQFGLYDPDLNFHGLTLAVRLPAVETVHGATWQVAADIEDCPELELVLPARKEAVETSFLQDLREAALLVIYRAMAAETDPRPSFAEWKRAEKAGIRIDPPSPLLVPWAPGIADIEDWREPLKPQVFGENAIILDCELDPPEDQAFWRAAERNGISERIFEPDRRLTGFDWYDAIPRITKIRTEITHDVRTRSLEDFVAHKPEGQPLPQRPEAIWFLATVASPGGSHHDIAMPADLAFANGDCSWIEDVLPLVTPDSKLDPHELADLLRAAFYSPSDDADADSWERQRNDFMQSASLLATRLLLSDDEARRRTIADVIARELYWILPKNRPVDIAVRGRDINVTFGPPEKQETS